MFVPAAATLPSMIASEISRSVTQIERHDQYDEMAFRSPSRGTWCRLGQKESRAKEAMNMVLGG